MSQVVSSLCRVRDPATTQHHQTARGLIHHDASTCMWRCTIGAVVRINTPILPREVQARCCARMGFSLCWGVYTALAAPQNGIPGKIIPASALQSCCTQNELQIKIGHSPRACSLLGTTLAQIGIIHIHSKERGMQKACMCWQREHLFSAKKEGINYWSSWTRTLNLLVWAMCFPRWLQSQQPAGSHPGMEHQGCLAGS